MRRVLSGNDCESEMCQWRTLYLFISIASRKCSMVATGRKCRALSSMTPRHPKRGASRIVTTVELMPTPVAGHAADSVRVVS